MKDYIAGVVTGSIGMILGLWISNVIEFRHPLTTPVSKFKYIDWPEEIVIVNKATSDPDHLLAWQSINGDTLHIEFAQDTLYPKPYKK